jgi:hypothetical protein
MTNHNDVESAKSFVENRKMTRKEIKLVRRMMSVSGFIPGLPKLSKEAKIEVIKILDAKDAERIKKNKIEHEMGLR